MRTPMFLTKEFRIQTQTSFEFVNHSHFESFEDFLSHLVITLKKIDLIKNTPHLAMPILYSAVAGMNRNLGTLYNDELLFNIEWDPHKILEIVQDLLDERNSFNNPTIGDYYIEKEYAIISLETSLRNTIDSKLKYLSGRKAYYGAVCDNDEIEDKNVLNTIKGFIKFCDLYIELLNSYGKELSRINAKLTEINIITFVDQLIFDELLKLIVRVINPKTNTKYFPREYKEEIEHFAEYCERKGQTKILFEGDPKTLAYCFYQLNKHKLLNRFDDPEKPYTDREIANIIFNNFYIRGGFSERSVYDYLRNGEKARPINPVFIVKSYKNSSGKLSYKIHKPKFRKKGKPIHPNDK